MINIPSVLVEPTSKIENTNLNKNHVYYPNLYMGYMRSRKNLRETNDEMLKKVDHKIFERRN